MEYAVQHIHAVSVQVSVVRNGNGGNGKAHRRDAEDAEDDGLGWAKASC